MGDSLGGRAVPEGGFPMMRGRLPKGYGRGLNEVIAAAGDKLIRAVSDGNRSLGVGPGGQTGDSQVSGFFLDAAGVGEDEGGGVHQGEEIEIAQGFHESQRVGKGIQAQVRDPGTGARMNGEDDRSCAGEFHQGGANLGQNFGVVDVGRAMEGGEDVVLRVEPEAGKCVLLARFGQGLDQAVDHDVPHEMDLFPANPFAEQIGVTIGGGRKKQIGQLIGEEAIDLLGHGPIKRSEAGLDMGHSDAKLGRDQSAAEGGIDVANNENPVGSVLQEDRLKGGHYLGGLHGM